VRSGAIIFVEIPVRDLARAADFYAGLFGWSFEDDENVEGWHFTPGSGGPMGRIATSPLAGVGESVSHKCRCRTATCARPINLLDLRGRRSGWRGTGPLRGRRRCGVGRTEDLGTSRHAWAMQRRL
jgi:catechol 2,3-dioxygenase-like lactoylglutathione lyase family enzyme